jgi:hypothetical protein
MRFYCVLTALVLSTWTARPEGNPYSDISMRNVFGLKDPPPPPVFPAAPPPRPAPNLVLTGLADFSTVRWAFVTRTDPGQQPKKHTLTFGETEGGLQLLALNAQSATATLRVDGGEMVTLKLVAPTNPPAKVNPPPRISRSGRPVYTRAR